MFASKMRAHLSNSPMNTHALLSNRSGKKSSRKSHYGQNNSNDHTLSSVDHFDKFQLQPPLNDHQKIENEIKNLKRINRLKNIKKRSLSKDQE